MQQTWRWVGLVVPGLGGALGAMAEEPGATSEAILPASR